MGGGIGVVGGFGGIGKWVEVGWGWYGFLRVGGFVEERLGFE